MSRYTQCLPLFLLTQPCLAQTSAEYLFLGLLSEEPASKVHPALPQTPRISKMSITPAFAALSA